MTVSAVNAAHARKLAADPHRYADRIRALENAGIDPDTAAAVTLERDASAWAGSGVAANDLEFARASNDPQLLLALARHDIDTGPFLTVITNDTPMTRKQLETCVHLGADPYYLLAWCLEGHHADDMLDALTLAPGLTSHTARALLGTGVSAEDAAWLIGLGGEVNHHALISAAGGITETDIPTRRIILLLVAIVDFGVAAATTIAEFTAHQPWTDTFSQLVADGTEPAVALRAARADHNLETTQQRGVRIAGTTTPQSHPTKETGRQQ
jgi:hypothetical protein